MDSLDMAGHLIRRLHQQSTLVFVQRTQAAGFDLTPIQFAALDAIHNHPGTDQATVAELIAYDRATIGGVIERLEQKGWVDRVVSERDRRARELSLTPEGQRTFKALTTELSKCLCCTGIIGRIVHRHLGTRTAEGKGH